MTGKELRQLRKSLKMSQENFAHDVLDVTVATVSRWERSERLIDGLKAEAIRARVKRHHAKRRPK